MLHIIGIKGLIFQKHLPCPKASVQNLCKGLTKKSVIENYGACSYTLECETDKVTQVHLLSMTQAARILCTSCSLVGCLKIMPVMYHGESALLFSALHQSQRSPHLVPNIPICSCQTANL